MADRGPGGPLLGRAAGLMALTQNFKQHTRIPGCSGLRLCTAARGFEGDDPLWSEVSHVMWAGLLLEGHAGRSVMEVLALSEWPLTELLLQAAAPHGKLSESSSDFQRSVQEGIAFGACSCDLSLWAPSEARAVAAAQLVLEEINTVVTQISVDLEQIYEALRSVRAQRACDGWNWDARLLTASSLLEALDWQEDLLRLVDAELSAWDPQICLPGVVALGLVCSARREGFPIQLKR
ncbi:unnamed protein product [Durusdinium trenchii]|uniref:Uncharacterized protein n=1 Tax=Durusdinium trenchii TaxID=1381693 RepID=A0ABP0HKY8_9DINO